MIIQKKAYAKINLYLKILDRLSNGYHNIFTIMQRISLCDDIKITLERNSRKNHGTKQKINITCANQNIPTDRTNTVYKAAELFFDRAGLPGFIIDIDITKRIPSQAGLGGGSSDAASVLLGLNEYFNYIFPENILMDIASKIGADVPFFAKNINCAICGGIGEIVTPSYIDLSGFYCLIAKPVYNVSTKQAYDDFDKYNNGGRLPPTDICICIDEIMRNIHNDFSGLIFSQNKNIKEINDLLFESGATAAGLSGSGSALFAVFDDLDTAQRCGDIINSRNDIEFCDIFDFLY